MAIAVNVKKYVAPTVAELKDTEHYVIIFKPNVSTTKINNQIKRIKLHQTNQTSTINSTISNHTLSSKKQAVQYSTIGNFKWYHAQFHTTSLENYLSTNDDVDDTVHYWVKDAQFSLQEFIQTNPPSWGLDRIDQRIGTDGEYRFASSQGAGVTIYLMDTGIRQDHNDIDGRVTIGKTVVGDTSFDNNGHGTFVAGVCCGTKYGVAKKANIVSVKTLDDEGNGRLSDVLVGLQWIVEQHISKPNAKSIVNLSLGAFYSQPTNDAITEAIGLGIHFSIAAGNYGEDACRYSPGSTPGAITVGAFDEDDSVSYYSNFGKCVDIFAPGTNIKSIWPTSKDATHKLTGTSMAAPHVAGAMAIFLSENDYTPLQLATYIKNTSTLRTEDFTINNTGTYYSENKTVVDNAIDMGYQAESLMNQKTRVNLLYSHPSDGKPFWVYGRTLNAATNHLLSFPSSAYTTVFILTMCVTLLVLL
ncbi:hypothetical protein G6F57_005815 [Rhizopus arrhizus]|uniref:Peptidase S8/S53 domain-containing protein n=1 Tax=Rhizopus oryzae TaxID=64495 RepID=A0A9P6XAU4_RHIOR|nr:hypothetical protein G6F23_000525 [Rhizopus arrhizus]KAG0790677.1 hypothetical protein G6F21_005632 [Rhizopus arrhizus]KAG0801374.1 hypothetical protein G6F22_001309 [Rhizopus arrhizus]KAG0814038.1 hypothetical protein G6F20_005086 [Rhizopus arrhizus]KAG0836660.1 hypothetical protein G6F18_005241 [Rhizopus arrhizus]